MRTTSKIIVGGYLFMTILSLVFIIVQSKTPKEKVLEFSLANDRIETKELPPFSVFKLMYVHKNTSKNRIYLTDAIFTITESKTDLSSFDISETFGSALLFETIEDTLICKITLPDTIKQVMKDHKFFHLLNLHCNLSLPKGSSTFVHNDVEYFNTNIKNVEFENLSLESRSPVRLTSSKLSNFSYKVAGKYHMSLNVNVTNSTIKNYNLDLDHLGDWSIKESRIGKLNLSSEKQVYTNFIPYVMCDEVIYTPKNKKASLEVKLTSPTRLTALNK